MASSRRLPPRTPLPRISPNDFCVEASLYQFAPSTPYPDDKHGIINRACNVVDVGLFLVIVACLIVGACTTTCPRCVMSVAAWLFFEVVAFGGRNEPAGGPCPG